MTIFFKLDGKSLPVEFNCEAASCPYSPGLNERCKQCMDFKVKLTASDFYKITNKINSKCNRV